MKQNLYFGKFPGWFSDRDFIPIEWLDGFTFAVTIRKEPKMNFGKGNISELAELSIQTLGFRQVLLFDYLYNLTEDKELKNRSGSGDQLIMRGVPHVDYMQVKAVIEKAYKRG